LGLEHIHSKDIVYRDLKPENVLIDSKGYIRITDFGLSKMNLKGDKDAMSVCGTPEYLAPEVILKKGHGKNVDWWTLGSIMYEMLTGLPPFYTPDREKLFDLIKYGKIVFPATFTPSCQDLLNKLFIKDPDQRLGSGKDGSKNVKAHDWFKGVNWDALLKKEIKPPFVPVISGEFDVSNFDPEFTETPVVESYTKETKELKDFGGFTYEGEDEMSKIWEKSI